MTSSIQPEVSTADEILAIEGPDSSLLTYYALASLAAGPFFPFVFIPLYFRYHTMRYRFSDEGVSMRWGVLFRKEINLAFARIQDIHLTSNFVERWLGLARIQIQTASGSSKAEMTIEGVREFRALRDFLYVRMRGAKGLGPASSGANPVGAPAAGRQPVGDSASEVATTLRQAVAELRAIREALEARGGSGGG
ncbi:MAG: PH domain-containing protein [Thermoanaerobaculales bacterium]